MSELVQLPYFPLNLVAFPGETLNLHIFESRYKQLVGECLDADTTFVIPCFINDHLPGYGTEMEIVELVETYDDGKMDIRTRGLNVVKLMGVKNPVPGKLYAGGKVKRFPPPPEYMDVLPELEELVHQLYAILREKVKFSKDKPQPYSYQIAHGVGLPLEGEYSLLMEEDEIERQRILIEHLQDVIPMLEEIERTKARISMNGHFREFDPLNF